MLPSKQTQKTQKQTNKKKHQGSKGTIQSLSNIVLSNKQNVWLKAGLEEGGYTF